VSTSDFCPNCGTHLQPDDTACPNCGHAVHGAAAAPTPTGIDGLLYSAKTKPGYWIGGAAAVAVVVLLAFGNVFGPSGKTVCTATLNQARDFGVISPSAVLDSTSAKSTDVKNRKSCTAKVGDETYTLIADIKNTDAEHRACRDYIKQASCVALFSVARADGTTTYQVRDIPANDTDEALAKEGVLGLPPTGTSNTQGAEAQGGGEASLETETAVGTGAQPATPQEAAPPAQDTPPPQQ
jgi:hypothetical protein